jgi:hypothetical protein
LIQAFANLPAEKGCECQNRITSVTATKTLKNRKSAQ